MGGIVLVLGVGAIGYAVYQKRQRRLAAEANGRCDDDLDDDDKLDPKENHSLIKKVSFS